jgi:predicted ATPase with chaperone activity
MDRAVDHADGMHPRLLALSERKLHVAGCEPRLVADAAQGLLKAAMARLQLSARAYHRVLKLAHTIADLAESERIEAAHVAEALQYRPRTYTP